MPFITFESEAARLAHPQASLIPIDLWGDALLFGKRLDESLIPLLSATNIQTAFQRMRHEGIAQTIGQKKK